MDAAGAAAGGDPPSLSAAKQDSASTERKPLLKVPTSASGVLAEQRSVESAHLAAASDADVPPPDINGLAGKLDALKD